MAYYGLLSTLSNDESQNATTISPPLSYIELERNTTIFTNETPMNDMNETPMNEVNEPERNANGKTATNEVIELQSNESGEQLEFTNSEFEFKIVDDLERNRNEGEFEHTLSEAENKVGPFKEFDSVGDSTDVSSLVENGTYEEKSPLLKKTTLLGLLLVTLVVIAVALSVVSGLALRNAKREKNEFAISTVKSAINDNSTVTVVPTESPTTNYTESPTETPCDSIYDLACSTEGLETLCALIVDACNTTGLELACDTVGEFAGPGPFTVFAPSNAAFQNLSMVSKLALQTPSIFNDVILTHTVQGKIHASDLVCDATVIMENKETTTTLCEGGDFYQTGPGNNDIIPKIITTDVEACNGVVHVVDQVILPAAQHSIGNPSWHQPEGFQRPIWDDMNPNGILPCPYNNSAKEDPDSDGEEPCQDQVVVTKPCYTFGEPIEVTFRACSPREDDWLGVFELNRDGRMRWQADYWELPCGGQNASCPTPVESGTLSMNIRVDPGRYKVSEIGNITSAGVSGFSTFSSEAFRVAMRCPESSQSVDTLPSKR